MKDSDPFILQGIEFCTDTLLSSKPSPHIGERSYNLPSLPQAKAASHSSYDQDWDAPRTSQQRNRKNRKKAAEDGSCQPSGKPFPLLLAPFPQTIPSRSTHGSERPDCIATILVKLPASKGHHKKQRLHRRRCDVLNATLRSNDFTSGSKAYIELYQVQLLNAEECAEIRSRLNALHPGAARKVVAQQHIESIRRRRENA